MSTRYNRLNEAVLLCTHNICFEQKYENIKKIIKLKIVIFTAVKKSLYIAWACFRNGNTDSSTNDKGRHYAVFAATECHLILIAQPAGVLYNRGVSSLKPVSKQLAKTLITLEPHGIF